KLTQDQKQRIEEVSAAYARQYEALERMNSGFSRYALEAGNLRTQLDDMAMNSMKSMEDALLGVVTGATSASEAFHKMADAIIADLARIAIRKAITGPISSALGGLLGGFGGGGGPMSLSSAGGTGGGLGGLFADGGYTGPGGKFQ